MSGALILGGALIVVGCGDDGTATEGASEGSGGSSGGTSTGAVVPTTGGPSDTTTGVSASGETTAVPTSSGDTSTGDDTTTTGLSVSTGDDTTTTGVSASDGTSSTTDPPDTTGTAETTDTTDGTTGGSTTVEDPDNDGDGVPASLDCNDMDVNNFPGNEEVCDEQDNDCDVTIDEDATDAPMWWVDGDMDGYGLDGTEVFACDQPPGTAGFGGDCNDEDPDAYPDGNKLCPLGATCKQILATIPDSDDGLYLIDPDGVDTGQTPFTVYCDMMNGGRTAALIINSRNEGVYIGKFGENYTSTQLLGVDPAVASSGAATPVQAWADLNSFPYSELWVAGFADGAESYESMVMKRSDLRIAFGQNGYLIYNDSNGYYWCGGDKAYTDAGQGQVNQPMGAPADCKKHTSLGSGWDFSLTDGTNQGLTMCGGDASIWMNKVYGQINTMVSYPNPGVAYVVWVR